jgi:hypothetical protein
MSLDTISVADTNLNDLAFLKLKERIPEAFDKEILKNFFEYLAVDTTVLQEIIDELFSHLGIESRSLVPHDRFGSLIFESTENIAGAYASHEHVIFLNTRHFNGSYTGLFLPRPDKQGNRPSIDCDPRILESLLPLHTYIHEQLHAASNQGLSTRDFIAFQKHTNQIGYVQKEYVTFAGNTILQHKSEEVAANEGVTELLILHVLKEYVRRVGDYKGAHADDVDTYFKIGTEKKVLPYRNELAAVTKIIDILTNIAGVPREEIKQAIIHGYFKEGNILSEELETTFRDLSHTEEYKNSRLG